MAKRVKRKLLQPGKSRIDLQADQQQAALLSGSYRWKIEVWARDEAQLFHDDGSPDGEARRFYHWHQCAANGEILSSSQDFTTAQHVLKIARRQALALSCPLYGIDPHQTGWNYGIRTRNGRAPRAKKGGAK